MYYTYTYVHTYIHVQYVPSECDVKWKMYKCHMKLKEKQEALDIVSNGVSNSKRALCNTHTRTQLVSIPLKKRNSTVALALGKLYHHFKQETYVCMYNFYKQNNMFPIYLLYVLFCFVIPSSSREAKTCYKLALRSI